MPPNFLEYVSRAPVPSGPGIVIQPPRGVDMPALDTGAGAIAGAVTRAGNAVSDIGAHMQVAQETTQRIQAQTNYVTGLAELETKYQNDPEYQSAPKRFREEAATLKQDSLGGISNPLHRSAADLYMSSHGITAQKRLDHHSRVREASANIAADDIQEQADFNDYQSAGSQAQRDEVRGRRAGSIGSLVGSGWINEQDGAARNRRFNVTLDRADAMKLIRDNPEQAQGLLKDPKNFPALDPVTRENFINGAYTAAGQIVVDRATSQAETDPEGARAIVDQSDLREHDKFRALRAVDQVVRKQEADRTHTIKDQASAARSDDDVLDVIKRGLDVDPARIESVRSTNVAAAMRGDRAAAQYVGKLDQAISLQPHIRAAWSMDPAELDVAVKRGRAELFAAGANATKGQVDALAAFEAVHADMVSKRESEPVVLGGERGGRYYKIAPIDVGAAASNPAAQSALIQRGVQALGAQRQFGGSGSPFTKEEASAEKERWAAAGPAERFATLRALAQTLPEPVYKAAVKQIAGDADAAIVGRIALDRPELAKELLQGQAILGGEGVPKDKVVILHQALAAKLGGQVYPSETMQSQVVTAARALYAARRGQDGTLYDAPDASAMEKAIEDITGPIEKRNGVKTPLPPMLPRAKSMDMIQHFSERDLELAGGSVDRQGQPVPAADIARYGQWRPLEIGGTRYVVDLAGHPVMDKVGFSLVVDLAAIAARPRELGPPTAGEAMRRTREQQLRNPFPGDAP